MMKNSTLFKHLLVVLLLVISFQTVAQNFVPFNPRFNKDVKGDILLIGNNILGPNNNAFNSNGTYNNDVNMRYIDIDGDGSTYSSSSADLIIPNPECYKIIHAGLYWGAVTPGNQSITNVKFKGPSGSYNDVVGTVIYDAGSSVVSNSFPYACYADVTSIVEGLTNNQGTYTVANVSSAQGRTSSFGNGTGYSAGWSLFIVYEDPTLPGKSITSFDGFSSISSSVNLNVPVSGFRTVPSPSPVRANFAFAALEGDKPISGDRLRINGSSLSATDRSSNNFFNSSVTQLSGLAVNNRNPNSTNTLGFDTGILNVPNPSNSVIANDATSAVVRLESSQDAYFPYFYAFAVEIIEPKIVLTKIVEDVLGNDIGGQDVTLGDQLNYVIGFQNTGNDNATEFTIKDILPVNVTFNYPADLGILPPGVSVKSYNPLTREIIFEINDSVVEINDPVLEIRLTVRVVTLCNMLSDACSNSIDNQAYATYKGDTNPSYTISDDPSLNTNTGCLLVPKATNFLVGVDDCLFTGTEVLCGATVELTAASGYNSYSWSTSPTGTPVIGTSQSITVSNIGTYYVHNTAVAPCLSINQEITVVPFGGVLTNPVIPFADEVVICPNDGKQLPNIFLCGANASRDIVTGISDGSTIIWEKLNEGSCAAVFSADCANESTSCTWTQVGTGPDYTVNTSGQFRVTLNYAGGCFNRYYFNSYQNLLSPTVSTRDIICTTPGQIIVGGVPAGYEYSLDNINYQTSNIFTINTQNTYTVYIKQVGVTTNPCIFSVPDIQIRQRNFTVSTVVTPPLCHDGKGSVKLAANDVRPQYSYSIYNGATLVNSVGPIDDSDYTFLNLNPGTYSTRVETEDGCLYTGTVTIANPPLLAATSAITKPLTCTDGEITVYPTGGTAPYFYFVNSTTEFQDVPQIDVTASGVYNITVVDSNNCSITTSITVDLTPAPVFNVTKTDILCSGSGNTGSINVNVTNANGNSLLYSIDNGVTFVNSPTFTGLANGNYEVVVQYTTGPDACTSAPQTINIATLPAVTGTATLTTPYTCLTTGTITVSGVSGGTSPYTYSIDGVNFQSGLTFSSLTNGSYTITIRDANNCTFNTAAITVPALNPPTDLTFSSSALTCPTNTSTVTITGTTGGVGALQYQIIAPAGSATAYQSSNTFSGLAPNTYTFQVKDANDCIYNESYTITPLTALTVVGQLVNDVSCFGSSNGAVRYTVSGTSNFTYTINGGTSNVGTSPINLTGLAAGTYVILIRDTTTNCQATASVTVNQPATVLGVSSTSSPITCITNGSVVINATGGWGGNAYTLTQPDGSVLPSQSNNTFNNLSQIGTYIATVTDSRGCAVTSSFTLTATSIPTASISSSSNFCYGGATSASLVVTATGGNTPYEYNINGGPFQTSNTFANLTPGNYTIIVRDAYGCTVTLPTETIAQQLATSSVLTKELDCTISPDALITGNITGGYAPFTYEISISGSAYTSLGATGTPFTYSAANAATYQFRVTDSRGCQSVSNVITVNPITNPTVTATATNVTCNGASNGTAQLVGSGGSGGYTFSNDNITFGATSLFTGLSNGAHTFYIKDSKNCVASVVVNITQPTPLAASASTTAFSCSATNTKQSAVITIAVPTTGTAPYQY
ncbi:beta strand repeat-containing protein, partial [Mariniflexile fucanivorans]|uniref:beta strand repeat-containing protein n=1 Tax=Mariniflexile fucanivorans TaxID=264023 RepID=UPI003F4ADE67